MTGIATTSGTVKIAETILNMLDNDIKHADAYVENPEWYTRNVTDAHMNQLLIAAMIAKNWRREGRQALAIHPELAEEIRVAKSDKIYPEFLRALPYINPMVVYPEAPVFKAWSADLVTEQWNAGLTDEGRANYENQRGRAVPVPGTWMRLMGFVTYATRVSPETAETNGVIVNTDNPNAEALGLLIVFEVLDAAKRVIDLEMVTITMPNCGPPRTLAEMARAAADRQYMSPDAEGAREQMALMMLPVMQTVVGTVLYLASSVTEVEKVPAKLVAKHSRVRKGVHRRPLSLYKVGWTTGAALRKIRVERLRKAPSEMPDIGHAQQDPHPVKAHFRNQWYGPRDQPRCSTPKSLGCQCGGQHCALVYISSYWTHRERLGEAGVNFARKVV